MASGSELGRAGKAAAWLVLGCRCIFRAGGTGRMHGAWAKRSGLYAWCVAVSGAVRVVCMVRGFIGGGQGCVHSAWLWCGLGRCRGSRHRWPGRPRRCALQIKSKSTSLPLSLPPANPACISQCKKIALIADGFNSFQPTVGQKRSVTVKAMGFYGTSQSYVLSAQSRLGAPLDPPC